MKWIYPVIILLLLFVVVIIELFDNRPAPVPESFHILQFENEFEQTVSKTSQEYGSVSIEEYNLGFKCDNICINTNGEVTSTYNGQEVSKFQLEGLYADNDFCVEPKDDKVTFRFEGIGNATRVSSPNSI